MPRSSLLRPLRRSQQVLGVVIIGLVLHGCAPSSSSSGLNTPTVAEVIDGDTVVVDFDGNREIVRLLGIDTPETVDPSRPEQCFGAEASTFLASVLPPGTPVRLERDVEARDRFGRLLAYIFRAHDGRFVNRELVRNGYADVAIFTPNTAYRNELEHDLATAVTAKSGLWGVCDGPDAALDPPPVGVE